MSTKTRDGQLGDRDAYFARQWEAAEGQRKKHEDARRRKWREWIRGQSDRATYSPWLVIPAHVNDYGLRPLSGGMPHWASPFIWVDSPDPSGKPLAGATNHLVARLFNLGAATAAPTKVDFYWADPSVGLGAADAHHVGTEWVELQPMTSSVVTCSTPWIPTYINNGHECAFVICDNHVLDPVQQPFMPWADRHVGQRNLAVLPAVQQSFALWAPLGPAGAAAELRCLALRGTAPRGLKLDGNAFTTLGRAAHELVAGLRQLPREARRKPSQSAGPAIVGERLDVSHVVRAVHVGEERRAAHSLDALREEGGLRMGGAAHFGDTLVRLPVGPGMMAQVTIEIGAMELAPHEVVVLNIALVAFGAVLGGYCIVIASPAWFGGSTSTRLEGGLAVIADDEALKDLVIKHNVEARVALQVVQQCSKCVPIASLEALERVLPHVSLGNHKLMTEQLRPFMTPDMFPVRDADDLVRKVTAGIRMAAALSGGSSGISRHPALAALHEVTTGQRPSIPAGHFTGPSIFGFTTRKGG